MVKVRLAPSPTGFLHIGTARTALFNYLFARQKGGQFLLRIEDTDKERSKQEYEKDIVDGLKWLGLNWDGEITHQSERVDEYKKIAKTLVDKKLAYEKDEAIYFKVDSEKEKSVEFEDIIRGKVSFKIEDLKDFVILKSDGMPTFHLAVVVDDEAMEITHVIRGEDHLSNTPLHILLQKALGYKTPIYAHIPLIFNADHTKMSKRKDPVSITRDFMPNFRPETMVNFLSLLGWHPTDEREFFTLDELTKEFSLERVQKAAAIFDRAKLENMEVYWREQKGATEEMKTAYRLELEKLGIKEIDEQKIYLAMGMEMLRSIEMEEMAVNTQYIYKKPEIDAALLVFKKSSPRSTKLGLEKVLEILSDLNDWTIENIKKCLKDCIDKHDLTNGDVYWPMRFALSGKESSPSPEEIATVLGKEETINRIRSVISQLD